MTLDDIIQTYIPLPHTPSGRGFYSVLCAVCNDSGRKGPRAGFKFDNGAVGYHCFNCSLSTKYDPNTMSALPKKMVTVLKAFRVPQSELDQFEFQIFAKNTLIPSKDGITPRKKVKSVEPMIIPTPEEFYFLKDADENDKWAAIAKTYLNKERGIDWEQYPFMLAKRSDKVMMIKWLKRLIIPMYKNDNLIFYQGRDLSGTAQKKYQSPSTDAAKVLYGFDKLRNHGFNEPLYVVEGWFDAFLLDGVALLGNTISEEQEIHLNRCTRPKIYVPDRFGDGKEAAMHALSLGWGISTPDIGSDPLCKDITDVMNKYGKLYTMKTLAERAATGFAAEVQLELYCK